MARSIVRRVGILVGTAMLFGASVDAQDTAKRKPLFRDFMGLNVHTVQFKPELYKPVTRLVRDYHPFNWDVGDETDYDPQFPFARNRVDWETLYGSWKNAGYTTHVSVMFDDTPPGEWKDLPRDAWAYGFRFGRFFGPSGRQKLVESVEIGNEPGKYDDAAYRALFQNVAEGIRKADPALKISTCAVFDRPSGDYHKSVETVKGLEPLYDILNVHSYAFAEQYPTWRRSYPEDDGTPFRKDVLDVIAWRDANAPGKQVWLTEFGWDATTKPQAKEGTFKEWVGVTDAQQAQYLVRAFLTLAEIDLDRAYIYFFNDGDEASVHAASGLTRNFEPKPAFRAVAHLYATLGEYRFSKVVLKKPGELYVYEFVYGDDPAKRIWAVWSPTGSDRKAEVKLPVAGIIERAERMPLAAGSPEKLNWSMVGGEVKLEVGESPAYLLLSNTHIK